MRSSLVSALVVLSACGTAPDPGVPPELANTVYDPHPQTPRILREVAQVTDDVEWANPFVPGHRTTMDGRVAIRVQGGPPGPERVAKNLSFFLFVHLSEV